MTAEDAPYAPRAVFYEALAPLHGQILYDATASAAVECGKRALDLAEKQQIAAVRQAELLACRLDEARADAERLRGELAAYRDQQIFRCMDRDVPQVMVALHAEHAPDGSRIRTTDTGRELVLQGGAWLPPWPDPWL